jgi:alkylmercury lyase
LDQKLEICHLWRERRRRQSAMLERLRYEAFSCLRTGRVATDALLGDAVGLSPQQVAQELALLAQQGLIMRDGEEIVGIYGLSLLPTAHRLCLDRQPLFTWCALDAVGIPAGLEADAEVAAQCFDCDEPITVTLRAGRVTSAPSSDLCIWLTPPQEGRSAMVDT